MQRNSQEMVMWARAYWKNEPTVVSAPSVARPQMLKAGILGAVVLALLIGAWFLYQWRFGH
jgi:predicted secreted protein